MTTTATVLDATAKIRAIEPRIDELPELYRPAVAGLMLAGASFEDARSQFLGIIEAATTEQKQIKEARRTEQERTTKTFTDAVAATIKTAALGISEASRPKAGWTLIASYSEPQKNPDGSPVLDEQKNPVMGFGLSVKANWSPKVFKSADADSTSDGGQRGRVSYVSVEGRSTQFKNLGEAAKDLGLSSDGNVRATLEANGYMLERNQDSNGKSRFLVSKKHSAPNGQTPAPAPATTPDQTPAF